MADSTRNVFDVLEDDLDDAIPVNENTTDEVQKADRRDADPSLSTAIGNVDGGVDSTATSDGAESQNWTDVSRTRRLVPKYSLSKEVMGLENTRNRGSAPPAASTPVGSVDSKKKVIRFAREEILSLRKPSKALPELLSFGDIIFMGQQEPECFKKLDADEVYRLWHAAPDGKNRAGVDAGRGRGRGRGRSLEGDDQNSNDWTRGAVAKGTDHWDDIGIGGQVDNGLDLADFSAATLKFRTEMGELGKDENIELYDSNDVMEGLFREQKAAELNNNDTEEDESRPEWADVDVHASAPQIGFFTNSAQSVPQTTNAGGRAILNALLPSTHISSDIGLSGRSETEYRSDMYAVDSGRGVEVSSLKAVTDGVANQHSPAMRGVSAPEQISTSIVHPLPSIDDALWMYLDPRNRPQGPFSTSSMRQWMVDGYFAPTLPIKLTHWSDFHPLYSVYLDAMSAFQVVPLEPLTGGNDAGQTTEQSRSAENAPESAPNSHQTDSLPGTNVQSGVKPDASDVEPKKKEKAPKASKVVAMVESVAVVEGVASRETSDTKKKKDSKAAWGKSDKTESTSKALSEIQAEERKSQGTYGAKGPITSEPTKNKSSQLKSLLGLPVSPQKDTSSTKPATSAPSWASTSSLSRVASGSKSLKEIQDEEEKVRKRQEALAKDKAAASIALSVQAAPKWKVGSSNAKPMEASNSPSLAEIMQQEEKARQGNDVGATNSAGTAPRPAAATSWAAKASKISTGGSYNAVPVSPVTRLPGAISVAGKGVAETHASKDNSNTKKADEVESFWNFSDTDVKPTTPAPTANQAAGGGKKQLTKNDFGGSGMPAAMSEWCTAQLLKLKDSSDLTLIQFCYTLQSPVEIREYFAEYLGSTPQVSQFATEFIQRKEGKAPSAAGSVMPAVAPNGGFQSAAKKKKAKTAK